MDAPDSNPTNRRQDHSSESTSSSASTGMTLDMVTSMRLFDLLDPVHDHDLNDQPAQEFSSELDLQLHRMLSLHGQISTNSTAATRQAQASISESQQYRKIGAGACGAIFAQDGKSVVVKLAKAPNSELWNDYVMHSTIQREFCTYNKTDIRIPSCHYFISSDDTKYYSKRPGLVQAAEQVCNMPTDALIAERILPLPEPLRLRLIEKYCAPRGRVEARADPANGDCLVRVYLGSTRGRAAQFFSLRNLKLHLNQLIDINLNVEALAHRMASALAIMHWAAKTDARDVEFVLGSATTSLAKTPEEIRLLKPFTSTGPESRNDEDFFHRTTELWVLDFNQVREITMDEAGVRLAVEAVKLNDPYFPKPMQQSTPEKRLWNSFATKYIETSNWILGKNSPYAALPPLFIRGLIDVEHERQARHRELSQ